MRTRTVEAIVCLFLAAAATADITTSNVNVVVTGTDCSEWTKVYLVINGDDRELSWIELEPAGEKCRWTKDLGDAGTISTKNAKFSLRVNVARSDCRKARANETEMTANLEFACCTGDARRNLDVRIEPSIPLTYVRNVQPLPRARLGVPCVERATFEKGQGVIRHTQFDGEDVYLNLGQYDRKRPGVGLLIDGLVVDDGTLTMTRDGVVYRLTVQRAQGKSRSAPTLSPNASLVDMIKLGELKFERARIEVIK